MIILSNNSFHTVRGYQILNSENKVLTSSMEDYLEMMYRMYKKNKYIRIKDLSKRLNVAPASVTNVIRRLKELNYIDYEKYGIVNLKESAIAAGHFLLKRHKIVGKFLKNLGIKNNLDETEMLEHDISSNTLKEIYIFNKFLDQNIDIRKKYFDFKQKYHKNADIYINKNP